jgi:hypothetical protein
MNKIESKRITVTLDLSVVTFPSGSQWITDVLHDETIQCALHDAEHELGIPESDSNRNLRDNCIEARARQILRDNPHEEATFRRVKDGRICATIRESIGFNTIVDAAIKLNYFTE